MAFRELHQRVRPDATERAARLYFWRLIRAGKFPAPVQLSDNRIAWEADEIEKHLGNLPRVKYAPKSAA